MEEVNLTCPYCLQAITMLVDLGLGEGVNEIVEDCEVCCRPIELSIIIEDNELKSFSYNSIEGNEF